MTNGADGNGGNGERHARFVEEIADAAAQKVLHKVAWFLVLNAGALITGVVVVVNAYYATNNKVIEVDARVSFAIANIEINNRRIESLQMRDAEQQQQLISRIDEINRFLRDHNTQTLERLRNK